MDKKLVFDLKATESNRHNSEGSFIRIPDGRILFAYSHYFGGWDDHDSCDIAAIYSDDEGETWSEPKIIVRASDFGVLNIMSVSALYLKDGRVCLFFVIKEKDKSTEIGRAVSVDGINFTPERCKMNCQKDYYVINNDRVVRLMDGRLAIPVGRHNTRTEPDNSYRRMEASRVDVFISEDDGQFFEIQSAEAALHYAITNSSGLQEPGLFERKNGTIYMWARTDAYCQYQFYSLDNFKSFTTPEPSIFTSPLSPMELYRSNDVVYSIYNPTPAYNGRKDGMKYGGRTPFVIRKSLDDGVSFGPLNVIEDDEKRGYCYPAMFETKDKSLLVGYCRGGEEDEWCLVRLGIMKIKIDTIE